MVIFCQKSNADDLQVEEAVVVLRQSLAKAESKSVTIVTVGFLINIRLCNSNLITNTTRVGISDIFTTKTIITTSDHCGTPHKLIGYIM